DLVVHHFLARVLIVGAHPVSPMHLVTRFIKAPHPEFQAEPGVRRPNSPFSTARVPDKAVAAAARRRKCPLAQL
ncbi:MAG: hypothetical protein KDJ64_13000, partial [Nitratireductor sp.]|nr:hypothetical protein [Nitratireductor sp.]